MADRPSRIWKDLPPARRVALAEAFWRDNESPDIRMQHAEAIGAIARRLNFRPRSVQALPTERRARQLAQIADVSDSIATRALIAYHFSTERALMTAFLDALGVVHENGVISDEHLTPPDRARLTAAASKVCQQFPVDDVELYLRTLTALDGDTWRELDGVLPLPR
jgi:hypothetical protein